jgi:predicted enzyme related to lactoylglutathione lyase
MTNPINYSTAFVAIAAAHFEAIVHFYRQLLDQPPKPYVSNRYAEFQLQGLRLGIFQPSATHHDEFTGGSSGALSLCLEVAQLEDAIAIVLASGGACTEDIAHTSHGRETYAYDPAGNRLILHEAIA